MIIAFATTVTLLPALLTVMRPRGEKAAIGYAALAPLDSFLQRRRNLVVGTTLTATILALPLLAGLRFDFNPLDLRAPSTESVSTLLDLLRDPKTSPNTIDILEKDLTHAEEVAARLRQLPEVARALTLQSFVPEDQEEKLAVIDDASFFFQNTLNPEEVETPPSPDDTLSAIEKTAQDLRGVAGELDTPAARQARRLAGALVELTKASPAAREGAEGALVRPLMVTLRQVRDLFSAEAVSIDTLPASLKRDWISADGEARIEVAPSGDGNDNATLHRFVDTVRRIAPEASGSPVFIIEAAATIVRAFLEAGLFSIASIALILYIALRRWSHVALTLVPLLVAIVVTLELCVAIGLEFNFANIIALPLLLGVGVAFKIYYVVAWRGGETNFLQSSLTRAVFFSACATATAFGSLWLSHHPGTSSMGKLMALSLLTTLSAAVIFQPALLATQNEAGSAAQPG
jgi:hopanoid biosynthesis associated RND transporter like protein HpnN